MDDALIHSISVSLANYLNRYSPKEGTEFLRVVLGIESYLINITKSVIVFAVSAYLGIVPQTLLTMLGFAFLRRYAYGLHSKKSINCTVVSVCMFVLLPFSLTNNEISNLLVSIIFAGIIPVLYLFAPADTEARPLVNEQKRRILKKRAVINGFVLLVLILLLSNSTLKISVTLGAVYEAISILPITYKILKRRENNYEEYERGFREKEESQRESDSGGK